MPDNITFLTHMAQGFATLSRVPMLSYHYNPRKLVFELDKMKLFHYQSKTKNQQSIPLLVVFATVNRPEILDLFPDHSFIGGLLESGMDVYLLDWGYPDKADQDISFNDYVTRYLHHAIQFMQEQTQQKQINLLGICQGGLLCLCYAALFQTVKNLVLISAPIDFDTPDNTIATFFKKLNVDDFVNLMGNIPGMWLTSFFISLRPFELVGKKYLRFIDHVRDPLLTEHFLQVEKWLYDAPDQTGASFTELVKECYQQNKLIKGELYLGGHAVDLSQVTIPILNVMASQDEIVPMSASSPLKNYVDSKDYSQLVFDSGHIGIYISDKVGKRMPEAIAQWLGKRKEQI